MPVLDIFLRSTRESVGIYWMLARIIIPVSIFTEILVRVGVIKAVAPVFAPVMNLVGLPSELGLAWLTAMFVGMWGAVPLLFTLVPVSSLSVADVTIFSSLILFAHGLPVEQKIIQKVGPTFSITTVLRIVGGLLYAFILHQIFLLTSWLAEPVNPTWVPMIATPDWFEYIIALTEAMFWMLIILVVLSWVLELLKLIGLLDKLMIALTPMLRIVGIQGEAKQLTVVGLLLGISFGAGLLIREATSGAISPRQIFLSCVFMGFAHSIIEDTIVVIALGADVYGVLVGRLVFTVVATAAIASLLQRLPDKVFSKYLFTIENAQPGVKSENINS